MDTPGRRLGLDWVTAAEVRHVHGALQTNAVSLVSAAGRGCYATVSLLSHSCVPNLEPAADPGRVMRLRAKRRISRGEQLTMRSEPGTFTLHLPNIQNLPTNNFTIE